MKLQTELRPIQELSEDERQGIRIVTSLAFAGDEVAGFREHWRYGGCQS
jgi:hypothetical protein